MGVSGDYQVRLNLSRATTLFFDKDLNHAGQSPKFDVVAQRAGYRAVDGLIVDTFGLTLAAESFLDFVADALEQAGGQCTLRTQDILTFCA